MPQMGESIAEGTIVRWIKKVGDKVDRDEPLFEISTDKVDAEIPSPAAGVVSEIRAKEGETVPVNSVVAVIGAAGEAAAAPKVEEKKVEARAAAAAPPQPAAVPVPSNAHAEKPEDVIRQRSSPLVRKIAKEHNVDISHLQGTGIAGRVTKDDILGFIGQEGSASAAPRAAASSAAQAADAPSIKPGAEDRVEKMSVMRKRIAEHMVLSRRTSAHVHSVFEVNFARVAQVREAKKAEYERSGAKLTYLSFILKAVVDALQAVPVVNASIDGDSVVYHKDVNVGIAVALDWGLIVPVIKNAEEKNFLGIARAINDLAERARAKKLKPDEVAESTFSITNPGVFGGLFGLPVINQPNVAILGLGAIEKRPVVVDDAIAIRSMVYLTLSYDHRVVDGAAAHQFMGKLKHTLENWTESIL
jgi:pyruvate dehydrogenase E2 component (dihydrolipoamide acetyltransferase)